MIELSDFSGPPFKVPRHTSLRPAPSDTVRSAFSAFGTNQPYALFISDDINV